MLADSGLGAARGMTYLARVEVETVEFPLGGHVAVHSPRQIREVEWVSGVARRIGGDSGWRGYPRFLFFFLVVPGK